MISYYHAWWSTILITSRKTAVSRNWLGNMSMFFYLRYHLTLQLFKNGNCNNSDSDFIYCWRCTWQLFSACSAWREWHCNDRQCNFNRHSITWYIAPEIIDSLIHMQNECVLSIERTTFAFRQNRKGLRMQSDQNWHSTLPLWDGVRAMQSRPCFFSESLPCFVERSNLAQDLLTLEPLVKKLRKRIRGVHMKMRAMVTEHKWFARHVLAFS